jgi:hypothetical protein|tara:strand:+ start:2165 stop:2962 length:798 start_codon:yes stop_codon:yes gene_type:complete
MAHGKIRVNTLTYDTGSGDVDVAVSGIPSGSDMAAKAPLASPALTGTPTAPTASSGTNNTQLATTAYADNAASVAAAGVVSSAPSTLDTLNELAAALGDDANFSTTVTNSIAAKAALAGATFTGDVTLNEALSIERVKEKTTITTTSVPSTVDFDVKTQAVLFQTGSVGGDWTYNIRGDGSTTLNSLMATGETLTVVGIIAFGTNVHKLGGVQIDGTSSNVFVRYVGGAPTSNVTANAIVTTTMSVIKTADATYNVLVSQAEYEA